MPAPDGLLIVDKPAGWTSHDVVARCRRLCATKKVGHAGTLDPMATGVLVVGVGRATRLLGHLALTSKQYVATIRLGETTVSDDADGEQIASTDASQLTDAEIAAAMVQFTGEILQVPSSVSAVKLSGERAYDRVRAGQTVDIPARPVTVARFAMGSVRREAVVVDVDVEVECSSGTYVRALARDLGAALGVGGHLTSLRRTSVGGYDLAKAHTLESVAALPPEAMPMITLDSAAQDNFAWYVIDDERAAAIRHGRALAVRLRAEAVGDPGPDADSDSQLADESEGPTWTAGERGSGPPGPVAVLTTSGEFLALYEQHGPVAKAVAVFAGA